MLFSTPPTLKGAATPIITTGNYSLLVSEDTA